MNVLYSPGSHDYTICFSFSTLLSLAWIFFSSLDYVEKWRFHSTNKLILSSRVEGEKERKKEINWSPNWKEMKKQSERKFFSISRVNLFTSSFFIFFYFSSFFCVSRPHWSIVKWGEILCKDECISTSLDFNRKSVKKRRKKISKLICTRCLFFHLFSSSIHLMYL